MKNDDVSEGSRELVDLSAEARNAAVCGPLGPASTLASNVAGHQLPGHSPLTDRADHLKALPSRPPEMRCFA